MITILRMGCDYHHTKDFSANRENGYDCYLALFVKSRCVIKVNGENVRFEPNTFILYNKHSPHFYGADNQEYIDDWIQFECDDDILSQIDFELDKPICIKDSIRLADYFRLIMESFFQCKNERINDYLIKAMLLDISGLNDIKGRKSIHYRELLEIRRDIYAHPEKNWTVKMMADKIHVSEPYFQEIYKKTFRSPCITDVISSRILTAKNLLTNTYLTVEEIAFRCGYNSTVHFSRQFRQVIGTSPSKWRNKL